MSEQSQDHPASKCNRYCADWPACRCGVASFKEDSADLAQSQPTSKNRNLAETIQRFERPGASPEEIVAATVLREFSPIVEERDQLRLVLERMLPLYMELYESRFGKYALTPDDSGMVQQARKTLSGVSHTVETTASRDAEIVELRGALLMLYDKWENGAPCYEEPEEQRGYFGHAFNLTEKEESRVLALLPEGCPEPSEKA